MNKKYGIISILVTLGLVLSACSAPNRSTNELKVVASTTLVGDVVKQVGGDRISLTVLLPVGTDPHAFEPRPQDAAAISEAGIIFLNGLGLEQPMEPVINSNARGTIVSVSDGIDALPFNESQANNSSAALAGTDVRASKDPHTWMDPNLVIIWVQNIAAALSKADPVNTAFYEANAKSYITELSDLDAWIRSEVAGIPVEKRKLVTDHESLGYFARGYGFKLVGLVVASLSSSASPSAQELAALENTIRQQGVPAIFVDTTVNPALAQQVARDMGIELVSIYNGSLGDANSGVTSYLQFMKTNVGIIVAALK